ncbi:MAG: glycine--tRNA ligase subunit beta [Candidatus Gastranaerophilales bacterium]|nr:glycine--tRNA ligase subunit beta [Candidatus Gastranaerophilales bacterium]
MNKYLLEIGTEELPYKFIPDAEKQLQTAFKKFADENGISYSEIKTYATPRRLTVLLSGLPDKKEDIVKTVKGPIATIAYDKDGNLAPAGLGFAKKNNVAPENLYTENNYVYAKIEEKGKSTKELLEENVSKIIASLNGSHFMRWADFDVKFQRPIRWLVSLFNNEEAKVSFLDVTSGKVSRGHRFSKTQVPVDIENYEQELMSAHVIADAEKRKAKIVETATQAAKSIGAEIVFDEDLLDEVTYLTEWPVPVICDFDEKYLKVPDKVTVTVMAVHQRYFPLYKDGKLLNKFITMANFVGTEGFDNIKAGNERVVTARLEDGVFFFEEDTKKPLEEYLENLKDMTFQKGMGSMYDKTLRVVELSKVLAEETKTPVETIERTAKLCKADLATSLVFEFTELQGFIGCDYAKHSGEKTEVAEGIKEHYFPLNANSELAQGIEGKLVGIADKTDTITVIFASGAKISGSQDPLGVRRAALGILKTILYGNVNINLTNLIRKSIELLPVQVENKEELFNKIYDFFVQRLTIMLAGSYKNDILDACLANFDILADLKEFVEKVENLVKISQKEYFAQLEESAGRVIRIIKGKEINEEPDENLFREDCEKALWDCIKTVNENQSTEKIAEDLSKCTEKISTFFDKVLVMDKDESVKNNRLKLLTFIKCKFDKICDFSKLSI